MRIRALMPLVTSCLTLTCGITAHAAVTPIYPLTAPAGWSVGAPGSTSQDWAADPTDHIDGTPNVSFTGAGLTPPTLSAAAPGFVAGSGGFYSFSGPYTITAAIHNSTITPPANAGTYVIAQSFATLNDGTVSAISLTDSSGNPIAGAQLLRSDTYAFQPHFASSFGDVEAQATIAEYWLPNFTGNFNVSLFMLDDVSTQEIRIDSLIASAGTNGAAPFALTQVPEPASFALLGAASLLLLRRRK